MCRILIMMIDWWVTNSLFDSYRLSSFNFVVL